MEMPLSRYRYRVMDGPTRMGSLDFEDPRLRFPILLHQNEPDPYHLSVVSGAPEWKGRGLVLEEDDGPIPDPILGPHLEELRRIKAEPLSSYASRSRNSLHVELDGDLEDTGCLVLTNVHLLSREPSKLTDAVIELRRETPMHAPLYLPGAASFHNLEFLIYIGIEVMDTSGFQWDAARGLYYTRKMPIGLDRMFRDRAPSSFCGCTACREMSEEEPADLDRRYHLLKDHNIRMMACRMEEARLSLEEGTLRELVMSSLAGSPEWMTAMRKLERDHFADMMQTTPTFRDIDQVKVTYKEDLNAPDHRLWRYRMEREYAPYSPRPVMLLLPCSAGKPYSMSRTHRRITGRLSSVKKWRRYVHRVVLTSPLGVVPMELEDLYPASYYDIPVTGEWSQQEVQMIRKLTSALHRKESPGTVVIYHGEGGLFYPEDLHDAIFPGAEVLDMWGSVDGKGDIELLRDTILDLTQREKEAGTESRDEDLRSLLRFSLGCSVEEMGDLYVRGTRRGRTAYRGRVPMFDLKKGGPVPTKSGGKLIWDLGKGERGRTVIIDDFVPRGTVFGQGIVSFEGSIHPGDVVVVGTEDDFRGIGRALVNGDAMVTGNPGPAVEMISHVSKGG